MVYFKLIEILTILCIINTTIAFKCWCCSSDEPDSAFCGKILDESKMSHFEKIVNLVECTYPPFEAGRDLVTKCMILKRTNIDGDIFYERSCLWEERHAKEDACMSKSVRYGHQVEACETCLEDKCNYKFPADNGSTHLKTLYHIVFILPVIVLII
ncbi:uncharacterized protein LOC119075696 [Bradysia coprophila]|uniref:uncharacterized protein LOC119075696 n=1 Tax=Bradysia coprophila TaxID=38358 RepID=UPI00187D86D6|nr:uncharacterized protein LOC119075696 [Bradysia coprophila]